MAQCSSEFWRIYLCCNDRLNREQLKDVVGEIVNSKREADGLDPLSDSHFCRRIEKELCHLQDLIKADSRESLRAQWLTHQSQLKHCENWEHTAVRLGFARELTKDEDPSEIGHVVWKKERLAHVLQFDEVNLCLDGTDESIGGRQSRIPTARHDVADSGQAAEKSGAKMTIVFGINFAGEALPPLLTFPSKAKDPANHRTKADLAQHPPQLFAQCGFDQPKCHNVPFAMNAKGGMNKEMLFDFFRTVVLRLCPNSADDTQNCPLAKMDSGPGRTHPPLLASLRSAGAHLCPGLPNGTESGQECDQIFGELKRNVCSNRDKLWKARFRVEGGCAALSMSDVGHIVFGGTVTMTDGSEAELVTSGFRAHNG